jgi:KDO2-lipid IV(A) lauroyltransferase
MEKKERDKWVEALVKGVGLIPLRLRRAFFLGLWTLFYHVSPRHRFVALHNLKMAYPEKSIQDITRIAKGAYHNLAIVCAEFFDLLKIDGDNLSRIMDIEGLENVRHALNQKKGVILFGAHFSNWEIMAVVSSMMISPAVMIYRPLDNLFMERLVRYVRTSKGSVLIPKKRAMLQMMRCLGRNGAVGLLIDQNVSWKEGIFVDFFGRPACTSDGLAQMALKTETPVLPAFIVRKSDGRYRLIIKEEIKLIRTGDLVADVRSNTQQFTVVIEEMIRQYPEQWLWLHQRWKTQPHQMHSAKVNYNSAEGTKDHG